MPIIAILESYIDSAFIDEKVVGNRPFKKDKIVNKGTQYTIHKIIRPALVRFKSGPDDLSIRIRVTEDV